MKKPNLKLLQGKKYKLRLNQQQIPVTQSLLWLLSAFRLMSPKSHPLKITNWTDMLTSTIKLEWEKSCNCLFKRFTSAFKTMWISSQRRISPVQKMQTTSWRMLIKGLSGLLMRRKCTCKYSLRMCHTLFWRSWKRSRFWYSSRGRWGRQLTRETKTHRRWLHRLNRLLIS